MRLANEFIVVIGLSLAQSLGFAGEAPKTILTAGDLSSVVTIDGDRIWSKHHQIKIYLLNQRMSIKYNGTVFDPNIYDTEYKKANDVKDQVRIEKHWAGRNRILFDNGEIKNVPVDIDSVNFAYRFGDGVIIRVRPKFHFWTSDFWYTDECVFLLYVDKKTTAFGNVGCKLVNGIVFVPAEASEIETEAPLSGIELRHP